MTAATLTALQVAVGLVLVGAGATKLVDLPGFTATLVGLGIGEAPARVGARLVAVTELGLGAASVAGIGLRVVNLAVLALMLAFLAVAAAAARWRPQVRCRCFGALSESRFGSTTVVRSLGLVAVSAVVVVGNGAVDRVGDDATIWTGLLLALAAAFAMGCAALANALDAMRRS